jgi:hypothetical protein
MNPQTPVLKRPDKLESGRRQLKSRDRLHVEARPESEDLTPRSDTTEQESPSTEQLAVYMNVNTAGIHHFARIWQKVS